MRGYLIWLIVALACSSMAEDPDADPANDVAKDPVTDAATDPATDPVTDAPTDPVTDAATDAATDPVTDAAKDAGKEPAKDSAKDPAKEPAKDAAKEPAKEPAKDPAKDPAKEPAKDPAKEPAKDPAKDFKKMQSTLEDILKNIKLEKKWMQHAELNEHRFNEYADNTAKGIPILQNDLRNVELELAKVNVMLERKELVLEHCLDSVKPNEEVRLIAKERVDKNTAKLEAEAKRELRNKYRALLLKLNSWNIRPAFKSAKSYSLYL